MKNGMMTTGELAEFRERLVNHFVPNITYYAESDMSCDSPLFLTQKSAWFKVYRHLQALLDYMLIPKSIGRLGDNEFSLQYKTDDGELREVTVVMSDKVVNG